MSASAQRRLERESEALPDSVPGMDQPGGYIFDPLALQGLAADHAASLRPNTIISINGNYKPFQDFCKGNGYCDSPFTADTAARYWQVQDATKMSAAVHKARHNALASNWTRQQLALGAAGDRNKLVSHLVYKTAYTMVLNNINAKGHRGTGCPAKGMASDTYTPEQFLLLCLSLRSDYTLLGAMDMAMLCIMSQGCGRSDDSLLMNVADICRPILMSTVGPSRCFLLLIILRGGKTDKSGRGAYIGFVRHKDPVQCAQAALGRLLWYRFSLPGEVFALPGTAAWLTTVMFPGRAGGTKSMSYDTQNRRLKKRFLAVGINITKVCHAMRHAIARMLDQMGVSMDMICRLGRWLSDAVIQNYLVVLPPGVVLPAAGFPPSQEAFGNQFWHPRFDALLLLGTAELYKLRVTVFPFIVALTEAVVKGVGETPISAGAVLGACEYLADVLVTDALDLAHQHPACPIFKSLKKEPVFLQLLLKYNAGRTSGAHDAAAPQTLHDKVDASAKATTALSEQLGRFVSYLVDSGLLQRPAEAGAAGPSSAGDPATAQMLSDLLRGCAPPAARPAGEPSQRPAQEEGDADEDEDDQPGASRMQCPFSRELTDVFQAYQEWFFGLNGRPPIIARESEGKAWRVGWKAAFCKRKSIIDAVCDTAIARKITPQAGAIFWTELQQRHPESCGSLNKVAKFVAALKKARMYMPFVSSQVPTPLKAGRPAAPASLPVSMQQAQGAQRVLQYPFAAADAGASTSQTAAGEASTSQPASASAGAPSTSQAVPQGAAAAAPHERAQDQDQAPDHAEGTPDDRDAEWSGPPLPFAAEALEMDWGQASTPQPAAAAPQPACTVPAGPQGWSGPRLPFAAEALAMNWEQASAPQPTASAGPPSSTSDAAPQASTRQPSAAASQPATTSQAEPQEWSEPRLPHADEALNMDRGQASASQPTAAAGGPASTSQAGPQGSGAQPARGRSQQRAPAATAAARASAGTAGKAAGVKKRGTGKEKKEKKKGPKGRTYACQYFVKDHMAAMKQQSQPGEQTSRMAQASAAWKLLTDEEVAPYALLAAADDARFKKEKLAMEAAAAMASEQC